MRFCVPPPPQLRLFSEVGAFPSEDVVFPNVHISRRRTKVRNEPKSRRSLTWAGLSSRSTALINDGCSDHKVIDRGAVGDLVLRVSKLPQ